MKRLASRLALSLLLLLAASGMVLQAGSVPHLHAGSEPGVYNEEHDLTLMAGLAGHVLVADSAPAVTLEPVVALLPPAVAGHPASRIALAGDSRAPPRS
jgi:hypothetical protein